MKGKYKRTISVRVKQSEAKTGINNPNFKGWYIVNGKKFDSVTTAAKAFGCSTRTIQRKAKDPKCKDIGFIKRD